METLAKAGIFRDLGSLAQDTLPSEQAHRYVLDEAHSTSNHL